MVHTARYDRFPYLVRNTKPAPPNTSSARYRCDSLPSLSSSSRSAYPVHIWFRLKRAHIACRCIRALYIQSGKRWRMNSAGCNG